MSETQPTTMASASTPTTTPSRLLRLPLELLSSISSHLPNCDIKNLRLVCRAVSSIAELRIPRVFLSANRLNVDVFHAIADHELYRKQVVEIVWDDARLLAPKVYACGHIRADDEHPDPTWQSSCLHDQEEPNYQFSEGDCPEWFRDVCEDNIEIVRNRKRYDVDRPDHIARDQLIEDRLPLKESWAYYQELLRQQEEVLRSGADINALRRGLECFPALKRVTITPLAHGQLFTPLYETPMIRAFPRGFNYCIPRTWFVNEHQMIPSPRAWNLMSEAEKNQWRGVRIILRELAHVQNHHVDELVIDVVHLLSGFNCTIFAETCAEYNDFVTLLRRPGFRRLDLALATPRQRYEEDWSAFRSGHLRRALAMARDMEHISLRTDDTNDNYFSPNRNTDPHFIPLKTIFPIEQWTHLRHFGPIRFHVRQADLLSLLASLPSTVCSVELSRLEFLDGNYRDLLTDIRDSLGWLQRAANEKPRVIIDVEKLHELDETVISVSKDTEDYLYGDDKNPFDVPKGMDIPFGVGIVKDAFNPHHERPNWTLSALADAGYIEHAYFKSQKL